MIFVGMNDIHQDNIELAILLLAWIINEVMTRLNQEQMMPHNYDNGPINFGGSTEFWFDIIKIMIWSSEETIPHQAASG